MSDRSYAQVTVYDCPEDQRAACLAAIVESFGTEYINEKPERLRAGAEPGSMRLADYEPVPELALGERYGDDECSLDMNETIAAAIIEAAPGATFVVWVDPKYEYAGALTAYAPDLGRFDADCDADGNPTLTAYAVRQILAETVDDDAELRARLRRALGIAHEERFEQYGQPAGAALP